MIGVRVDAGTISCSCLPLLLFMEGKREVYLRGFLKEQFGSSVAFRVACGFVSGKSSSSYKTKKKKLELDACMGTLLL